MLKEFKEFAIKGNVIDLAVGVIIGGAFGKIVTSLVNDVIMPLLSPILGNLNFSNLAFGMNTGTFYSTAEQITAAKAAAKAINKDLVLLNYGTFITNVIDFLIVAFTIFIVIRQINRFKPKPQETAPTTKECPYCKNTIHLDAVKCPFCTSVVDEDKYSLRKVE